jgi:ABC-type transporter Mla maintaining outer membrane lipid asymmetry ATPase subunit MlaF
VDFIRKNLLVPHIDRWPKEQAIIELKDVWKSFDGKNVLCGLNLRIMTGKTTVIAGESGSGKSVLLKLMNGLLVPDAGEVFLFGQSLSKLSARELNTFRKRCSMVFQNYALIDSLTVFDNIAFPLQQNTRMQASEISILVENLLTLLELPNTGHLLPSSLSGGMKKRVALARAVICNPEVVLFDEPTTGLDPIMIEFVDSLIAKTQRDYQITSVMISHDMTSNKRLADHMAILANGQIVQQGSFDEMLCSQVPEVKRLMDHAVTERLQREHTSTTTLVKPNSHTIGNDQAMIKVHSMSKTEFAARSIDLRKSFDDREILKGITVEIPWNKITVIIGGSGSGKSVLVKHFIGLLQASSGYVEVLGTDMTCATNEEQREIQSRIGVLFQGAALFDSLSVEDNIAFPLVEGRRLSRATVLPRVHEIANKMGVSHLLARFPDTISNGERKRVALARALITKPDIMIYDEPTTGQDPIMMQKVDDMIVEAAELFDMTSIVISHDMSSTFRIADHIAMIYQGELVVQGTPQVLMQSTDSRVQAFIFAGNEKKS